MTSALQPHVSLVSICTREKASTHPQPLRQVHLADPQVRRQRMADLHALALPAEDLYIGPPQRRLMPAVRAFRAQGRGTLDLRFLSAGFGLVSAQQPLVPYDCTFKGMAAAELRAWAGTLGIPAAFRRWLATPADLRLVLLTDDYLRACGDLRSAPLAAPTHFFVSRRLVGGLPQHALARVRVVTREDVVDCRCPAVALRAELGARVLRALGATQP